MILSAIYIEDHFLFDSPQIINFGGKYSFSFELQNKKLVFHHEINSMLIEDYYNQILMISAIVGANGAGKTSVLRILNQHSEENKAIFIYEENDEFLFLNKASINFETFKFSYSEIQDNQMLQSLYYSPSLDYDLQDIYSPISLSRKFNNSLSEFYFDNLEKQLFFLSSDKIESLKEAYSDLPFFTTLNVKVNNFNKNSFLNIYNDATLGKTLNQELNALWNNYNSRSEMIHNDNDFLKNLKIMLLSLLVLDDTYGITGANGFEIGFEEVMKQKTFAGKLNKFLEKRICNIDYPTYKLLKENYVFDINNYLELVERINRNKIKKIPGGFDFEPIKGRMINCIMAFKAVNDFYKFIRGFNTQGRLKDENGKVFVEFKVNEYDKILNLIKQYKILISTFKQTIQHDNFRILNFYPNKKFSTGEKSLLDFFSSLSYFTIDNYDHQRRKENYLLLLDEPELGYHALWKKKFIDAIVKVVPIIFEDLEKKPKVQIVFTTHDALTLSDIPNYNIILIDKEARRILSLSETVVKKAFGGNISDILSDSFFVGDGLIGDYAKKKIQDVIEYINDKNIRPQKKWIKNAELAKTVIDQIGEPYLNEKLNDMFLEAFPEFKKEEIQRLEDKLNKLRNGSNTNK